MESRINLGKTVPAAYLAMSALDKVVDEYALANGIAKGFGHLLRLRASQINGCSYCVRLHTRDAIKSGESADRIALVAAWRDCAYFNDKERAALDLIEAMTLIADGQVSATVYDAAKAVLCAEEIAALEWLGVVINAWNRIGISGRLPVHP